jgi:hypothetical protein
MRYLVRLEAKLRYMYSPPKKRTVTIEQLNAEQLTFVEPCFVLSTGRCGTAWLTELLKLSYFAQANHSNYPELIRHSRLAYEQYEAMPRVFCEIIRATRDEFIIDAYRREQVYVETNNRITFFAYALKQVYPKAKFIQLVRHPGHFVRSVLSRGWYQGARHDVGRLIKREPIGAWQMMGDREKIAWLWNETNVYIEDFLSSIQQCDYLQVRVEEMFSDRLVPLEICTFIGVNDIKLETVTKMMDRKINRQAKQADEPYRTWSNEQKTEVRRQAPLAKKYGYVL